MLLMRGLLLPDSVSVTWACGHCAGYSNVQMSLETYCRRIVDDRPEARGYYLAFVLFQLLPCGVLLPSVYLWMFF